MAHLRLGRPFAIVFTASTVSNVGDGVVLSALPLFARELTTDPLAISMVTVAATAPWLAFGLVAGAVVDRVDRVTLMARADMVRGAILLGLSVAVVSGRASLTLLLVTVLALGVAETLFDTAAQAILPAVVDGRHLELANGRLFGAQLTANAFVGPPLGAALFGVAVAAPFVADAVTFVLSAALVRLLPRRRREPRAAPATIRQDVVEGVRHLWRDAGVRAFAIGAAAVNVAHTAVMATIVLFARDELRVGAAWFGVMLAGAGIGSLIGTQVAPLITARFQRRTAVIGAVGTFAGALALAATARHAAIATLGLAVFGAAAEVWNVVAVSFRQARVPDRLLGRVMASYRVIAYGAMPVGAVLGGLVARSWGLRAPLVAAAAITAGLLLYLVPATRGDVLRTAASRTP